MSTPKRKTTTTLTAGDGISILREAGGLTTAEVARASGVRRSSIEAIERGSREMTGAERHDILHGIVYLFGRTNADMAVTA